MSIQKRAKILPWIAAFAVAVLVGILAVPSLAAPGGAKNFGFSFTPATANAGANNLPFSVTVTNTSPDTSSSNFSSMTIKVPSQFTGITGAVVAPPSASSNPNSGALVAVGTTNAMCKATGATAQTINVCNLDPTKRLEKVTITFNANVSDPGCGQTPSDNWVIAPFTGSGLTGTGFTEKPLNPTPYTLIQKACLADIKGQVWRNHNNNTTKTDPVDVADAETGQSGFKVIAFDSSGQQAGATATTGSDGKYTIASLPSGVTYTVCEFAPNEQAGSDRTWYQKVPGPSTSCTGHAADAPGGFYVLPNGNSVTLPSNGANDVDFLNARAVTVTCPGVPKTYSVGGSNSEPSASVTIPASPCKPGVYIFEAWVRANNTQEIDFYPTFTGQGSQRVTQTVNWPLTTIAQSLLQYDDGFGLGFRDVEFCTVDSNGNFVAMPTAPANTTTCLLTTSEQAARIGTTDGVNRIDVIVTLVDGKLRQTTP